MLDDPVRIGDMAALVCSNVTTLALDGPLSISSKLFDILGQPGRGSLRVLACTMSAG